MQKTGKLQRHFMQRTTVTSNAVLIEKAGLPVANVRPGKICLRQLEKAGYSHNTNRVDMISGKKTNNLNGI
jgi:hypothetical protein